MSPKEAATLIARKISSKHTFWLVLSTTPLLASLKSSTVFALVTRRPYCPGRPKKLCFTTPSLAVETMGVRLGVEKQSFFGLPEQYGRRVTRANSHFENDNVFHLSTCNERKDRKELK